MGPFFFSGFLGSRGLMDKRVGVSKDVSGYFSLGFRV